MADLTSVVEQAGKWPVGVAAAAAVGPSGVLASTGPVNRQFPLASGDETARGAQRARRRRGRRA
jgi:hypothetical protein